MLVNATAVRSLQLVGRGHPQICFWGRPIRPVRLVTEVANLREGLLANLHRGQAGALRVPQSGLKSIKDRR
jgi:hypothetical protein